MLKHGMKQATLKNRSGGAKKDLEISKVTVFAPCYRSYHALGVNPGSCLVGVCKGRKQGWRESGAPSQALQGL